MFIHMIYGLSMIPFNTRIGKSDANFELEFRAGGLTENCIVGNNIKLEND